MLKDSEKLEPHPTDPDKVCMTTGFLVYIFETCGMKEVNK